MDSHDHYMDAVKRKRVFGLGYCWRCAEHVARHDDLGLCDTCRKELTGALKRD